MKRPVCGNEQHLAYESVPKSAQRARTRVRERCHFDQSSEKLMEIVRPAVAATRVQNRSIAFTFYAVPWARVYGTGQKIREKHGGDTFDMATAGRFLCARSMCARVSLSLQCTQRWLAWSTAHCCHHVWSGLCTEQYPCHLHNCGLFCVCCLGPKCV